MEDLIFTRWQGGGSGVVNIIKGWKGVRMKIRRIAIVGGGYAGIKAGKTLDKIFRKDDLIEITLIDKNPYHTLMTRIHEVAGHSIEPARIKVDFQQIFAKSKVKIITDLIEEIDFADLRLKSVATTYKFDYLILAGGSSPNDLGIKGVKEYGKLLWSAQDAQNIRDHIEKMFILVSQEQDKQKELMTFVVVGGGFTGVEMAGELGELRERFSNKYSINKDEVLIYNIEATPRILGRLKDEGLVKKVENRYTELGIRLLKESAIVEVTEDSIYLNNGRKIKTKTLIWGAGIKANHLVGRLDLAQGNSGRIKVNPYMQSLQYENVFLAGDNVHYQDETGFLPQTVEAAEQTGYTAAVNIASLILKKPLMRHKQNYHGSVVSVGSKYAVANILGIKLSGTPASLVKRLINHYYLLTILGINKPLPGSGDRRTQ